MSAMVRLQLLFIVTLSLFAVLIACHHSAHASGANPACGSPRSLGSPAVPSSWLWASDFPKAATYEDMQNSALLRADLISPDPVIVKAAQTKLLSLDSDSRAQLPADLAAYLRDFRTLRTTAEAVRANAQATSTSGPNFDSIRSKLFGDSDGLIYEFRKSLHLLNAAILSTPHLVPMDLLVWIRTDPKFKGASIKKELGIVGLYAFKEINLRAPKNPFELANSVNKPLSPSANQEQIFARQEIMKLLLYTNPHILSVSALRELSTYDAVGAPDLVFDIELVRALAKQLLADR